MFVALVCVAFFYTIFVADHQNKTNTEKLDR